jgi:hypothetical protein
MKSINLNVLSLFVCLWLDSPQWARASSFTRFLDDTQRRTTVGRTPLGEWSARRRDLYLTTHNTHNRQISMPPVGFVSHYLSRREAADRAANGTGGCFLFICIYCYIYLCILLSTVGITRCLTCTDFGTNIPLLSSGRNFISLLCEGRYSNVSTPLPYSDR